MTWQRTGCALHLSQSMDNTGRTKPVDCKTCQVTKSSTPLEPASAFQQPWGLASHLAAVPPFPSERCGRHFEDQFSPDSNAWSHLCKRQRHSKDSNALDHWFQSIQYTTFELVGLMTLTHWCNLNQQPPHPNCHGDGLWSSSFAFRLLVLFVTVRLRCLPPEKNDTKDLGFAG